MPTIHFKKTFCIGLLRWPAGDAISNVMRWFAGFLVDSVTFDGVGLADMGKVEIAVERSACPDAAVFDSPVISSGVLGEVWFMPILE
jgi:hypothetical protein